MKYLVFYILFFPGLNSYGQTWDQMIYQGKEERAKGNFKRAGSLIARGAQLKGSDNFEHFYYAAIMYANAGEYKNSFELLDQCIDAGMYDWARWARNSRLKVLHPDKRWDALKSKMERSEQAYASTLSHPGLRRELKRMWRKDQDLVGQWEAQKKVVGRNTVRLDKIIEQYDGPPVAWWERMGSGWHGPSPSTRMTWTSKKNVCNY